MKRYVDPHRTHLFHANDFNDVVNFVDHGGYALRTYERWRRLHRLDDGTYRTRSRRAVQLLRMNIGTIVEAET